jgi:uncharacterized protein YkwD
MRRFLSQYAHVPTSTLRDHIESCEFPTRDGTAGDGTAGENREEFHTLTVSPSLQRAAHWHTDDVLNNRDLDADIDSDGSTPQDRARAAGFTGKVTETVAINPALAISGLELINQWYYNPEYLAIMRDCANTLIGVWSENSLDRTVVVAVYGQP